MRNTMGTCLRLPFVAVLFVALSSFAGPSWAAAVAPEAARALVVSLVDEAGSAFGAKDLSTEQRAAETLRLIDKYSNSDLISRGILGHHWDRATPENRGAFKALLASYVASARTPQQKENEPSTDKLDIGETETVGERVVVHSALKKLEGTPTPIDWVVAMATDNRPIITDIVSGGISLVRTMKADFTAVITRNDGNFDALLTAMRTKANAAAPK